MILDFLEEWVTVNARESRFTANVNTQFQLVSLQLPQGRVSCLLLRTVVSLPFTTVFHPDDTIRQIDARALARLQGDHINRALVPAFYRYLQAQDEEKQISAGKDFLDALEGLVKLLERSEHEILSPQGSAGEGEAKMLAKGLGLWIPGRSDLGWAEIMAGPCKEFLP